MSMKISITKRERKRRLKAGEIVVNERWVVQWTCPKSGARLQRFFERKRDAEQFRNDTIVAFDRGTYSAQKLSLTVEQAISAYIETRKPHVRSNTFASYAYDAHYVIGPILPRAAREARMRSGIGTVPKDVEKLPCLGHKKVVDLTTRMIREWHQLICDEVSVSAANRSKQILRAALLLAAEDFDFRPVEMPKGLQRNAGKTKKAVLTADQIRLLLEQAKADYEWGIYYAFPFLTGTRSSEQLGLKWEDIDFEANLIHIRRTQLCQTGELSDMTKTEAGTRTIPLAPTLRTMLLEWRLRCPRLEGKLDRVFPASGRRRPWPLPRTEGGGALLHHNFVARIWHPALKRAGLPPVTPHSARHSYISALQTLGAEVGLAARLAGHKSPVVTLQYYTHSTRDGGDVVAALDRSFGG